MFPLFLSVALLAAPAANEVRLSVDSPMAPPAWALLERQLLRAHANACREYYHRYFDDRGYLMCVERWGGDDGPDDAIENVNHWPVVHALGGSDEILDLYRRAWEGHLVQYTQARTLEVDFAREGMYHQEFPVAFDWLHNAEGLSAFHQQGLSDYRDPSYKARVRRFAGFYLNEDLALNQSGALNYDPARRVIRSMFNGSRGPVLRKATALDWAGDPIEIEGRFRPLHGERNFAEMLAHFKDYTDIVGDHPLNLLATSLATNAYLLTHEAKYRDWVLEYVGALRERMASNGGIIPSNVGLDGTIGGECGGKWYGGVYGWGFSVVNPVTGGIEHRNRHDGGVVGLGNALLLTGDQRYVDAWRQQIAAVNANARSEGGRTEYPHMHGDEGWYGWSLEPYAVGAKEVWYWSMDPADRVRVPGGWPAWLEGKDPGYPERVLQAGLAALRQKVHDMRLDTTTPDTRLADDPMQYNPATVDGLVELAWGGLHPGKQASLLHARLRYFDPQARRAGLPPDVAALIDSLSADSVGVTLVNIDPVNERVVTVQAGGYAEHHCTSVVLDGNETTVDAPHFTICLAPGAGARLVVHQQRYRNQPTLAFPWEQ